MKRHLAAVRAREQSQGLDNPGEALNFIQLAPEAVALFAGELPLGERGFDLAVEDGQRRLELVRRVHCEFVNLVHCHRKALVRGIQHFGESIHLIAVKTARQGIAKSFGTDPLGSASELVERRQRTTKQEPSTQNRDGKCREKCKLRGPHRLP